MIMMMFKIACVELKALYETAGMGSVSYGPKHQCTAIQLLSLTCILLHGKCNAVCRHFGVATLSKVIGTTI